MRKRRKKWLWVGEAVIVIACLIWIGSRHRRIPTPLETVYLGAVSSDFLTEALNTLQSPDRGKAIPWSPMPFCWNIGQAGTITDTASCDPFYRAFPDHPLCALQNLKGDDWDPDVVKIDPLVLAHGLVIEMKKRGCRWIMLDMESLRAKDRDRFSWWSATLVRKLRESIPGLHSTIAVHGKTNPKGDWHGAEAQDWPALCRAHDEILLMAYDFHYPGVTPAGETAPLDWVEGILRYGLSVCRKGQLRLGLAAYGYAWPTKEVVTERAARAHHGGHFYVETAAKRREKIALARRYGVNHFFLWAMGME